MSADVNATGQVFPKRMAKGGDCSGHCMSDFIERITASMIF
jgi:hypothetical protein